MRMLLPIRAAFSFLTRLPIGLGAVENEDLGRAVGYFPLVGAVLGALCFGAALLLTSVLPASIVGFLVVLLLALLTGGLHLDGVADVFDGLSGGRGDRERTLSIMRDSRIGAHGAAALALVLIGKVVASGELVASHRLIPLLVAPIVARLAAVVLVTGFAYARSEGLGRAMHDHAKLPQLMQALVLALACVVPALWSPVLDLPRMAAPALTLIVAWMAGARLSKKLGGLTGDVYGAAIELSELLLLLLCCAV